MNENIQNDRMAEQVDTVENTTHDTDQQNDEQKKEEQIVKSSSPVVYIALILASFFALGLYEVVIRGKAEPNGCQMTYMFEYPQYIKIKLSNETRTRFPNYALYAYGEGKMSEPLRNNKFTGIPVLFVPGNSGSHKQVRSFASVALRKTLDDDDYEGKYSKSIHFDYFAVDFGEELSAVYGGVLDDQSSFTALAVTKILQMYQDQDSKSKRGTPPSSVVLIGHSIGGVVAKAVFTEPDFDSSQVRTIVTLATPHSPVILLDHHIANFYKRVDAHWSSQRSSEGDLKYVTLFTIGGGDKDMQVRAGLTQSAVADISIPSATAVPGVWVSPDHRCIVWCKQLVLTLSRALFDSIDPQTRQITSDLTLRKKIFQYHLTARSGGKRFQEVENMHPPVVRFDKDGYWSDVLKRQFVFSRGNVTCNTYLMIETFDDPKHKQLTLDAVNMDNDNWVFGCKATSVYKRTRICDTGDNLSSESFIIPSNGKRKTITLDMGKMKKLHGYTHIVVFVPIHTDGVRIHVDVYNPTDRQVSVELPRWISGAFSYPVIRNTADGSIYYNISLKGLSQPWQAYSLDAEQVCRNETTGEEILTTAKPGQKPHLGLMRLVNPLALDSTNSFIGANKSNRLIAKLQSLQNINDEEFISQGDPYVELYLDPNCRHSVKIKASLGEMWAQMVRYYAPMVAPFTVSVILLGLSHQTKLMATKREGYNFVRIVAGYVSPVSVVMPSKILSAIILSMAPKILGNSAHLVITDYKILENQGLDFGILPIVMFFVSIGIVLILGSIAWTCVLVFGNMAQKTVLRYLIRTTSCGELVAEVALAGIERFPLILTGILIALTATTGCGELSLIVGAFCQFVHLFSMYKDHLEALVKNALDLKDPKEKKPIDLTAVNFQFTHAILWTAMALLNLPTVIAWAQNGGRTPGGGNQFERDPSLYPSIALLLCLPLLWGDNYPNKRLKYYHNLGLLQQVFAILNALYGCISIYRVSYFVSAMFISTAMHQMFAPELSDDELAALMAGQQSEEKKEETLIDGEVLDDEDENIATLDTRNDIGN